MYDLLEFNLIARTTLMIALMHTQDLVIFVSTWIVWLLLFLKAFEGGIYVSFI